MHHGDLTDNTNLIRIIQETHRSPYAAAKLDWGFAGDYVEAVFAEVELLQGDPSKAKEKLGWEPPVKFDELVGMMVRADLKEGGYEVKRYHE